MEAETRIARLEEQAGKWYFAYDSMLGSCMELVETRDKLHKQILDIAEKYLLLLNLATVIDEMPDRYLQILAEKSKTEAAEVREMIARIEGEIA